MWTISPFISLYIRSLGFSIVDLGVISAGFGIGMLITEVLWGILSDKGHIRKIFLFSCLGMPISTIMYVYVNSFWALFLLRAFEGSMISAMGVSSRGLTASFSRGKRGRAFGLWWAISGIAGLIGPMIGGYLASMNNVFPFYAGTIIALIASFMTFLIPTPKIDVVEKGEKKGLRNALVNRGALAAALLVIFPFFTFSAIRSIMPIYVTESPKFLLNELEVGLMFTIMSIAAIPSQLFFGELSDRIGKRILIFIGLGFNVLTFALIPIISGAPLLYLTVVLAEVGRAATGPTTMALMVESVPIAYRSFGLALYGAGEDAGVISGSLVYGYTYDYYGSDFSFYLSAVIMSFALMLSLILLGIRKQRN
jgi:DHA1 family multidrug resistance protein-like MFS transporter